jgi:multidrug efflux pump subunit AcrA (membrane-fusion protein)
VKLKQISPYSNRIYYIILVFAVVSVIWAYFMPVELTVSGRGYVSFLGEPRAVCSPSDGVVEEMFARSVKPVSENQLLISFGKMESSMEKFDIVSPSDGVLIWERELLAGDMVSAGERLAVIFPSYPIGIMAALQEQSLGRIAVGHPVRVKLDAYPYQNYGTLKGRVKEITTSNLPGQGLRVIVLVTLKDSGEMGLLPGMSANIEITTGKTSLLKKLLN